MTPKPPARRAKKGRAKPVKAVDLAIALELVAHDVANKAMQQPSLQEAIPHMTVAAAFRALSKLLFPSTPEARRGK